MPALHLIYAHARNRVIGHQGTMPWHLPEDLAHFKRTTQGHPVIMGRKTWQSLPAAFRPLPGRRNIVITRQTDWQASEQAKGAEVTHSLEAAIALCAQTDSQAVPQPVPTPLVAWVIGGADIYCQALPLAQQVVVTEIDADFEGDAFAPELGAEWQVQEASPWQTSSGGLPYRFITYTRAQPMPASASA